MNNLFRTKPIKQKKSKEGEIHTTNTKASADKPTVANIGMTRNQNKKNLQLFGSIRKNHQQQKNEQKVGIDCTKKAWCSQQQIMNELNKKCQINYMNGLYSDLLVQLGYEVEGDKQNDQALQNKSAKKGKGSDKAFQQPSENYVEDLVELKKQCNSEFSSMKNAQTLFKYIHAHKPDLLQGVQFSWGEPRFIHEAIRRFIAYYGSQKQKLSDLELETDRRKSNLNHLNSEDERVEAMYMESRDDESSKIKVIRQELEKEKRLNRKMEKQERFYLRKLYQLQQENAQLVRSCSEIQIKTVNLRDSIKLSAPNQKFNSTLTSIRKNPRESQNCLKASAEVRRCMSVRILGARKFRPENQSRLSFGLKDTANKNPNSNLKFICGKRATSLQKIKEQRLGQTQ